MRFWIFTLSLVISFSSIKGQADSINKENFASICFYRKKQFTGSGNNIKILINNYPIERIKSGHRLIFKVRPNDSLIIATYNSLLGFTFLDQTIVSKNGEKYFIEINWDKVIDNERPQRIQIYGLRTFIVLKEKNQGQKEFDDEKYYKDHKTEIKTISINPLGKYPSNQFKSR